MESLVPGPELVAALAGVDRDRLDGHDRATLLELRSRLRSWIDAEFYADIQSVSEAVRELYGPSEVEEVFETTSSEVRAAITLNRRAAEVHVISPSSSGSVSPRFWQP